MPWTWTCLSMICMAAFFSILDINQTFSIHHVSPQSLKCIFCRKPQYSGMKENEQPWDLNSWATNSNTRCSIFLFPWYQKNTMPCFFFLHFSKVSDVGFFFVISQNKYILNKFSYSLLFLPEVWGSQLCREDLVAGFFVLFFFFLMGSPMCSQLNQLSDGVRGHVQHLNSLECCHCRVLRLMCHTLSHTHAHTETYV